MVSSTVESSFLPQVLSLYDIDRRMVSEADEALMTTCCCARAGMPARMKSSRMKMVDLNAINVFFSPQNLVLFRNGMVKLFLPGIRRIDGIRQGYR